MIWRTFKWLNWGRTLFGWDSLYATDVFTAVGTKPTILGITTIRSLVTTRTPF